MLIPSVCLYFVIIGIVVVRLNIYLFIFRQLGYLSILIVSIPSSNVCYNFIDPFQKLCWFSIIFHDSNVFVKFIYETQRYSSPGWTPISFLPHSHSVDDVLHDYQYVINVTHLLPAHLPGNFVKHDLVFVG